MTIEKLKDLVGASKVEALVRNAAAEAAREGDWEKLEEIVEFAKENGLNVKPTTSESRQAVVISDEMENKDRVKISFEPPKSLPRPQFTDRVKTIRFEPPKSLPRPQFEDRVRVIN
jgi:hypothetical protein